MRGGVGGGGESGGGRYGGGRQIKGCRNKVLDRELALQSLIHVKHLQ